jgi:hypothetical protein
MATLPTTPITEHDLAKDEAVRLLCPFTRGTKLARKRCGAPVWVQHYTGGRAHLYDNDLGHVSVPTSSLIKDFVPIHDHFGVPI